MKEALKAAIKAMGNSNSISYEMMHAIADCKEALAQPTQTPLAKVEPCAVCGKGKARLSVLRSCDTCHSEYAGQAEMTVALGKPEQEVDWKDQYEKQKRRAEMWLAKYEEVAGPAPCAVPLAQTDYRAVKTYHEGEPVYVSQPEQEPVAESFMVSLYNRGYKDGHHDTVEGQYIDILRQDMGTYHSDVVSEWIDENLNTAVYTTPPKRPWVGLTDEEAEWCQAPSRKETWKRMETKLKEKNT